MSERLLTHLRHVDLAVPDYDRQLEFYAGVWGLTKSIDEPGLAFLAAEGSPENYVVRLRKADEKRLDLVSYGVARASDVDLAALAAALDGYSAANCAALVREAALTAMRESLAAAEVSARHLDTARRAVRPSLDPAQLAALESYARHRTVT